MEYRKVNYDIVQEACLASESKDQLAQIFYASATGKLSGDLQAVKADNLPDTLKNIPETLSLTHDKSLVLIVSLHNLLMQYIALCLPTQDESVLMQSFPEEFDKNLIKFLFKKMREVAPLCKEHI